MANTNKDVVLYVCFQLDRENEISRSLIIASDKTKIDQWKKTQRGADAEGDESGSIPDDREPTALGEETRECVESPSDELAKLMTRFQETMSGYLPLRSFVLSIMPTFRSAFIHNEVYKSALRNLDKEEEDEEFETYGVTDDQYPLVQRQIQRLREFDRGIKVLPGAILLSLVATFDSFVADTLRIMLRSKPERLYESSKTIRVKEILSMESFADVIDKVTEEEVEAIMRGSHVDQVKYIEGKLNVQIQSSYDEWGAFVEVFERRNLIAHGGDTINSSYIRNCKKHGFNVSDEQEGQAIELGPDYLRKSSHRLLEFGLSLTFVLWIKHFRANAEAAYESLHRSTYELIRDGQFHVAARLLDLALFRQSSVASERLTKMMTVNLANAYKKLAQEEKAHEIISGVDWSATTDDFQICIAAIREDIHDVVELMPKVVRAKLIGKSDFREWPVFDWIREDKSVREKFEEIYGEPLIAPDERDQSKEGEPSRESGGGEAETVH